MKRIGLVIACLIGAAAQSAADRFEYAWSDAIVGFDAEFSGLDGDGNVYVGLNSLAPNTEPHPVIVRKYDPDGALLWSKVIAGTEAYAEIRGFAVNPDGSVVVSGMYSKNDSYPGSVTFDPDGAAIVMPGIEANHIIFGYQGHEWFLLKLSANGAVEWVNVFSDGSGDRSFVSFQLPGSPITVAPSGDIYFADLNESLTWQAVTVRHSTLGDTEFPTNVSGSLVFRFGSDGAAESMVAFQPVFLNSYGRWANGLDVDASGRLRVYGSYQGYFDFDPGTAMLQHPIIYELNDMEYATSDAFILRLTPEGNFFDHHVLSSQGVDDVWAYGRNGDGTEIALAGTMTEGRIPPVLHTQPEFSAFGTRRTLDPEDDSPLWGIGLLRFDESGEHLDTRLLPHPVVGGTESDPIEAVPYCHALTKPLALSSNGDLYLTYTGDWEFNGDGSLYPHRDSVFSWGEVPQAFVKMNESLEVEWTVLLDKEFEKGFSNGQIRIGPENAVVYVGQYEGGQIDLDPTNGENLYTSASEFAYILKGVDVLEPDVVSVLRADPNPTVAPSVAFTVRFDEAVTGVDGSDFSLSTTGSIIGVAVTDVSGSGDEWTVTVSTGTGGGTIRLDVVDDDTILSATSESLGGPGLANGAFSGGEVYTVDYSGPVATFSLFGSVYTVSNTVQILIHFDEDASNVDASDFFVTNGVVTNVTGSGDAYVITVLITSPGDMTVDLLGGGITDQFGNVNGPATGVTVTFLDLNGDPSVPGPAGILLLAIGLGLSLAAVSILRRKAMQ